MSGFFLYGSGTSGNQSIHLRITESLIYPMIYEAFSLYRKLLLTEKSRNKNARARPGELKEDYGIGKI